MVMLIGGVILLNYREKRKVGAWEIRGETFKEESRILRKLLSTRDPGTRLCYLQESGVH